MKKVLQTRNIPYVLAAILAIHMHNLPFADRNIVADNGSVWWDLDISWQAMLSYANIKNWTWGADIIYTYGPLGFLATRISWGVSWWIFLALDLFIIASFFLVFKDYILASADKIMAVLVLFAITLLLYKNHGSGLAWILTFFIYYWIYKTYKDPKLSSFFLLSFIIVIAFYVKINTGIVNIAFLAAHLGNMVLFKKIKIGKALAVLGFLAVCIGLFAIFLHVDLYGYFIGSLETIKGYNDVMGFYDSRYTDLENMVSYLFNALLLLYIVSFFLLIRKKAFSEVLYVLIAVGYLFLLKKQAIIRADLQHLSEFVTYAPLVLVFGNLGYFKAGIQRYVMAGSLTLVVFALLIYASFVRPVDQLFIARYTNKQEYLGEIGRYKNKYFQHGKRPMPARILQTLSNHSVDIFPWDCAYIFQNRLNYTPRPVFQSFAAYTAYLEKKNYDFYVNTPPEFVVYDYMSIDRRYAFNDETWVNMFLAKNYIISDTFTANNRRQLLLQKKDSPQPLNFSKITEKQVALDSLVPLNVNGANFLKIDIQQNMAGKLLSFRFRPPFIHIAFIANNGEWYIYKTSAELLRSGIMADRLVNNVFDFTNYIYNRESLYGIREIKIMADGRYFSPEAKIEFYRVN